MKKSSKCMVAVLLAVLTVLSSFSIIGSFAAEDDKAEAPVSVMTDAGQEAAAPAEDAEAADADEPVAVTDPEVATEPVVDPAPEVGNVTGVKKTSFVTDRVRLEWNKTKGADGYTVYYCDVDKNKTLFIKAGDTANTYMEIKNLRQSTMHIFKIFAYVEKDGVRYEGEPTLMTTATQPVKVAGLLRTRSSEVISFKWNVNQNVTGYKVYRSSAASGNKFELVKTIRGKKNTTYADTNISSGKIYTYKVVCFRELPNGNLYHSEGSTITCMCGLCAPNFSISSKLYRVSVSWKRNPYATRYDVYYSTYKDAVQYTFAGSTTGTSFVTNRLSTQKLYFRVYPIYKKNGTTITGTSHTKEINVSNKIYGVATGSTYVEVNISAQRMWLYKNGKCIVDTPVVTGTRYSMDTPKGYFDIYSRARNTVLTGPGYASPVDYWMAFSGGCGIHDASWRSSFGGNIYTYNGSHGCINTPYNAVRTIYNNTTYGTPVIVY